MTKKYWSWKEEFNAGIPTRIAHSHIANIPIDLKPTFRLYTRFRLKNYSNYNFILIS